MATMTVEDLPMPLQKKPDAADSDDWRTQPSSAQDIRYRTIWQYLTGVPDPAAISPDNWNMDQQFLDRPGNQEISACFVLRLWFKSATLSPVAGIPERVPTSHANYLGQERSHLSRGGGSPLQARFGNAEISSARYRTFFP